jgi:hypothetical protein
MVNFNKINKNFVLYVQNPSYVATFSSPASFQHKNRHQLKKDINGSKDSCNIMDIRSSKKSATGEFQEWQGCYQQQGH